MFCPLTEEKLWQSRTVREKRPNEGRSRQIANISPDLSLLVSLLLVEWLCVDGLGLFRTGRHRRRRRLVRRVKVDVQVRNVRLLLLSRERKKDLLPPFHKSRNA